MLTEKDINIFTIVKDKNTISPLRQWCIDSWHKCMPEANIMIFDDNDLNNPNWKYYDVIKNDRLWNYYKNRKDILYEQNDIKVYKNKFIGTEDSIRSPISTDSIRIRLLKAIPNALYMDSDAYLNITSKEFLELCNKYKECDIYIDNPCYVLKKYDMNVFTFTGYFAGAKNIFLDNIIKYYDETPVKNVAEDATMVESLIETEFFEEYRKILFPYSSYNHKVLQHLGYSSFHIDMNKLNRKDISPINVIFCKGDTNLHIIKTSMSKEEAIKYIHDACIELIHHKNILKQYDNCKPVFIFRIHDNIYRFNMNEFFYETDDYILSFFDLTFHPLTQEFIQKLKETINIYFKPLLDNGKEINYYEIPNLGDDPCLLKKI